MLVLSEENCTDKQSSAEHDATKQEQDTKAAAIWQGDLCLTWCYQGSKSHT